MVKTTKSDFKLFKKECKKWITKFGLNNWDVYYTHEEHDGNRGSCYCSLAGYNATISLGKNWSELSYCEAEIRKTAFHEVAHLLLARLSCNAKSRYIEICDLIESEEEIIRILENTVWGGEWLTNQILTKPVHTHPTIVST